jgi:hypothetical protein
MALQSSNAPKVSASGCPIGRFEASANRSAGISGPPSNVDKERPSEQLLAAAMATRTALLGDKFWPCRQLPNVRRLPHLVGGATSRHDSPRKELPNSTLGFAEAIRPSARDPGLKLERVSARQVVFEGKCGQLCVWNLAVRNSAAYRYKTKRRRCGLFSANQTARRLRCGQVCVAGSNF